VIIEKEVEELKCIARNKAYTKDSQDANNKQFLILHIHDELQEV